MRGHTRRQVRRLSVNKAEGLRSSMSVEGTAATHHAEPWVDLSGALEELALEAALLVGHEHP